MKPVVEHIAGQTFHGRKGRTQNRFRYGVDYVMLDAEADPSCPALFSRNHANFASVHNRDHGGPPGNGQGAAWVRRVLREHQIAAPARIELLAQPRLLGHVFNPVSFWLCRGGDNALMAVSAEVTNTYGDRHSYLCHHPDQRPIGPQDTMHATKALHVSPFQELGGEYAFHFDLSETAIRIRIEFTRAEGGLVATLTGPRRKLTNRGVLAMLLRRPLGSRRVLALIHWQALKLWWKGARFRNRPPAPVAEVSRR